MKKTILQIYLYLVCFIALIVGVVSIGNIIHDSLKVSNPEFYMDEYEKVDYISNEKYALSRGLNEHGLRYQDNTNTITKKYTNSEITKMRNEEYNFGIQSSLREAQKSIISYFISLILSMIIFFVHWKISRNSQEV